MYRDGKNLLYFFSFPIVKISPHSKDRFHFLSILNLTIGFLLFLIFCMDVTNNLFLIGKISRHTILIHIILVTVPETLELPFL